MTNPIANGDFVAMTLLDAPLDAVDASLRAHLSGRDDRTVACESVAVASASRPAQRRNPPHQEVLLWAPTSNPERTVFFPNLEDGWSTMTHILGTNGGLPCVRLRACADDRPWPIRELSVYAGGQERRYVRAMKDDPRWDFFARGAPLAFEDVDAYSARRIRDRLTVARLVDYCEALGWLIADDAFWRSDRLGRYIAWRR